MAYTPVNWQTGDTITAERLNRMDRGWDFDSTQLFSETVTVTDNGSGMYSAQLAYSQLIDASTITVTFDGTEYVCPRIDSFGSYFYGGFTEQGPVFTEYPFAINSTNDANYVFTETASTHTVVASASSVQTSAYFGDAVNSCVRLPSILVVDATENVTDKTWSEINDEFVGGGICIVLGYGPVLQMWVNNNMYYMATGCVGSGNGAFDPMIWRTSGTSADMGVGLYRHNSQMP